MATPTTATRPTPERIFNALNAYQQTAALRTAIELDVGNRRKDRSCGKRPARPL